MLNPSAAPEVFEVTSSKLSAFYPVHLYVQDDGTARYRHTDGDAYLSVQAFKDAYQSHFGEVPTLTKK